MSWTACYPKLLLLLLPTSSASSSSLSLMLLLSILTLIWPIPFCHTGWGESPGTSQHCLLSGGLPGISNHLDPRHDLHVPPQGRRAEAQPDHQGSLQHVWTALPAVTMPVRHLPDVQGRIWATKHQPFHICSLWPSLHSVVSSGSRWVLTLLDFTGA